MQGAPTLFEGVEQILFFFCTKKNFFKSMKLKKKTIVGEYSGFFFVNAHHCMIFH